MFIFIPKIVPLKLLKSPGDLIKIQILVHSVWGRAQDSGFPTSSQVMPSLQGPKAPSSVL